MTGPPELSVLLPVLNERDNVVELLPRLGRILSGLGCTYEVLVVDGGSRDGTADAARGLGARVMVQQEPGYGGALREGFAAVTGAYVLTLDADLSHDPNFIVKLWRARTTADVVIASRYVRGGVAYMPLHRALLSRTLNRFFAYGLSLPLRDLSSGFRLYRARALAGLDLTGRNFEILEEVLVKAYVAGWRVVEIPFTYYPRDRGSSHARVFRFGLDLLHAFARLWGRRYSADAADADERSFYSPLPLRRHQERRRHQLVTAMARGAGRTLHVGCGSSVILQSLNDAIGLDVQANPLRYMRRYGTPLVRAALAALPVRTGVFDCVVCTHAIPALPPSHALVTELARVLRPGGLLILGLPGARRASGLGGDPSAVAGGLLPALGDAAREFEVIDAGAVMAQEIIFALRKTEAGGGVDRARVPSEAQLASPMPKTAPSSGRGAARRRAS